jgi:tRNA U34 5-carboxymethylaminomethyl modifying GTPase MnmE/TrmE
LAIGLPEVELTNFLSSAPSSFTSEDVLELHIHSGRAIINSMTSALSCFPLCRPAEPGEFTQRAYEKGRMDLTQVEGLKDLIDADTEVQQGYALRAISVSPSRVTGNAFRGFDGWFIG